MREGGAKEGKERHDERVKIKTREEGDEEKEEVEKTKSA